MSQPSFNEETFEAGEAGADMMPADMVPEQQYSAPRFDVYSMLLMLAFLFMTAAAIVVNVFVR